MTAVRFVKSARVRSWIVAVLSTVVATPMMAQEVPSADATPAQCPAARRTGWLGVSGLNCRGRCTMTWIGSDQRWTMSTEPEIDSVDPDGPARGRLRAGDILVAVDGALITTAEGGRRYGAVRPGQSVTLTVRRGGRSQDVELVAGERCGPRAPAMVVDADPPPAPQEPPAPSARPARPPRAAPPANLPDLPPPPPSLTEPGASLGLSFRCSECRGQADARTGRVVWSFSEPILVQRVEPGGPADLAGLRGGDRIVRVENRPIESEEAGRRFSLLEAGVPVSLTVSRWDGSRADIVVTPVRRRRVRGVAAPVEAPGRLRFTGSLGPADVEVRGGPVTVLKYEGRGELVIRSGDVVVRIRLREPAGEDSNARPRNRNE